MLSLISCAFIGLASAFPPSAGYVPKGANCLDFIIPVTVTWNNRPWIAPKWENNLEFVDFLSSASSRPSAGFPAPVGINSRRGATRLARHSAPLIRRPRPEIVQTQ